MRKLAKLEQQLILGEISESDLDILWEYHKEKRNQLWKDCYVEKDKEKKERIRIRRDVFDEKEGDFLKIVLEYMIFLTEEKLGNNNF